MNYQQSGVNIQAGNEAVNRIKGQVKATFNPQVLTGLGQFSACYELPKGYDNPVLVSCTDGVGTKLRVAIQSGIVNTVGIDLVAMCVNDLICCGAKPLFFLDYYACHALNPEEVEQVIQGIVEGCKQSDCALIGGEMAEMNDMYQKGDFDLAGFCVGVVEKNTIIDGSNINPGQYVYALPSSGIHSNGFSLVRKVLTKQTCESLGLTPKDLLAPTQIYVKQVLNLIKNENITGICHVTGGGLKENLERVLPDHVSLTIQKDQLVVPSIFKQIQKAGPVEEDEMYKVFNMGVGMVIMSESELEQTADCYQIGTIESGKGEVTLT